MFFDRLTPHNSWAVKALAQKEVCLKAVGRYEEALGAMEKASTHGSATEDETGAVRYLWARTLESQKRYGEARGAETGGQGKKGFRHSSQGIAADGQRFSSS